MDLLRIASSVRMHLLGIMAVVALITLYRRTVMGGRTLKDTGVVGSTISIRRAEQAALSAPVCHGPREQSATHLDSS